MKARARALAVGWSVWIGLGPTLALSSRAFAQDDPAITAEARKRFLEGVKLFDEKKYELARAAFVQAYALKKHPDVLLNLAESELRSGHYFEAVTHFKDFLRDPTTAQHPKRADAQKGLDEARTHTGRVQVTVDVPDADVLLDGKKVGTSPVAEAFDVTPGPHVVEVQKGDKKGKEGILATEGKIVIASVSIGGAPPPPPPPKEEPAPPKEEPKPPKPEPKEEPKLETPQPTSGSGERESFGHWVTHNPVAWVGGGLVVLGGVGLVAFEVSAGSADSNKQKLTSLILAHAEQDYAGTSRAAHPCAPPVDAKYANACNDLQTTINEENTDKTLATIGGVMLGVGAVTLVGGYFLTAKTGEEANASAARPPRIALSPVIGPRMRGLGVAGAF